MTQSIPKTIAIIDGNSLMHRAFHAVPDYMSTVDGTPTNACFGFMQMLLKMIEQLEPDGIICAFDGGIPEFRFEAIQEYKAQRPPTDPNLKAQFPVIEELLKALDIPVVRMDKWEGDDILGTLGWAAADQGSRALLVSGDRDVLQLVGDLVNVVTTKKGLSDIIIYDREGVYEKYGIYPEQVPDYLGLKGDTSDNYPGIPGIGEKTAAKLLQEYGSLEEILAHGSEQKGKLGERLTDEENIRLAHASRRAATISRNVPVELDLSQAHFPTFDSQQLADTFGKYELSVPLGKFLALAGVEGAASSAAVSLATEPLFQGQEAQEFLSRSLAQQLPLAAIVSQEEAGASANGQLQLLLDEDAGPSLQLVLAGSEGLALFENQEVAQVLAQLFHDASLLVTPDAKALLHVVFPVDSGESAVFDSTDFDPSRVFDLSLAAYLLDSSASDYSLEKLSSRYLHQDIAADENQPKNILEAAAALALYEPLRKALEQDDSWTCFAQIEMPLVPVLARMERLGVAINVDALKQQSADLALTINQLRNQAYEIAGEEFNLDSPKQLGVILFEKLGLPAQKKTQTGYSTDASVLESLSNQTDSPMPSIIMEYRELSKMRSTYLDALPRLRAEEDARIHTSFNQSVAATGRLSSSNPNLQNIPVRTELGRTIRAAFISEMNPYVLQEELGEDAVFFSADYSQIELRLLAHLSQDPGLIAAFSSGEDFHASTASAVFGVDPKEVTTEMRSRAKAVNFGIVYGQQAFGLGQSLHIPLKDAQEMIDRYYQAYPLVRAYLDQTVEEAKETGYSLTMWGRKRHIRELKSKNYAQRQFGERTAMNHPMQGSAADIIKLAMIEVDKRLRQQGLRAQMVLQVHDELDFVCPVSEIEALAALVTDAMTSVADLSVPLEVSVAYGPTWADAK